MNVEEMKSMLRRKFSLKKPRIAITRASTQDSQDYAAAAAEVDIVKALKVSFRHASQAEKTKT